MRAGEHAEAFGVKRLGDGGKPVRVPIDQHKPGDSISR
jgi:hypothetical protein